MPLVVGHECAEVGVGVADLMVIGLLPCLSIDGGWSFQKWRAAIAALVCTVGVPEKMPAS